MSGSPLQAQLECPRDLRAQRRVVDGEEPAADPIRQSGVVGDDPADGVDAVGVPGRVDREATDRLGGIERREPLSDVRRVVDARL